MTRRKSVNNTGILRVEGIPYHDAWVAYKCVNCQEMNTERVGSNLLTPSEALENAVWKCKKCGYIHSRESDLPFTNWQPEHILAESTSATRFWEGFFRVATEHAESYWKQCNVCTRILSNQSFSKHTGWGPLEKQMECRACKGAINALLNPKRTKEQLHESAVRRRIADLFLEDENETINFEELFERFGRSCFKTKESLDITKRATWSIDHILPSRYLYGLKKDNAALLSKNANENKRDQWPSKYFSNNELIDLARITGANIDLISSANPVMNKQIDVNRGVERYLQVREHSDLPKRIKEIKKILLVYELVPLLSEANRLLLGF